ncbi:MAG TPA: hypothetical protein VEK06_00345 [Myxococcota bacterium]|nr:hypothetical protein [Myxococcota bacterium]
MSSSNLDNLVKSGQLKEEPANRFEIDGLVHSAQVRLRDAENTMLSPESRFDLAYNAAHALSLAALRWRGYRSTNRYMVFQALSHTAGLRPEIWRVLSKCHQRRNLAEYEGEFEIEEQLLTDLLKVTRELLSAINALIG